MIVLRFLIKYMTCELLILTDEKEKYIVSFRERGIKLHIVPKESERRQAPIY